MKTIQEVIDEQSIQLICVHPSDTADVAAQKMADHKLGAVIVMDALTLVGIVSERDLTRKIVLAKKSSDKTMVKEIMVTNLSTIAPTATLEEALSVMNEKGIRHLPVVTKGAVLACVSILDVTRTLVSVQSSMLQNFEKYVSETWPL